MYHKIQFQPIYTIRNKNNDSVLLIVYFRALECLIIILIILQ